jgi:predicted O-methyltransferase YrrM
MITQSMSNLLYHRPRLLNLFHALGLAKAHSQTNPDELATLEQYARGQKIAVEIGTYMGVSATVISRVIDFRGTLYCVDPWLPRHKRENPCWTICKRELVRNGVLDRVVFLQGYSRDKEVELPDELDFIFIDGDHSYPGLQADWQIVIRRLKPGGIVCLHDTSIPVAEPHRRYGSNKFFEEVISQHSEFERIETCYSMNVLRRLPRF